MKILIGGSPCTHWSIAQTKNRETEASGIGWELFLNYRIARDKYQPDFFLYENNKSMSPAIRAQITAELGVEPVLINSALVSTVLDPFAGSGTTGVVAKRLRRDFIGCEINHDYAQMATDRIAAATP